MIFHLFTLLFVGLKLAHVIDWSWWLVFLPSLLRVGIGVLIITILCAIAAKSQARVTFKRRAWV